MAYEDKETLTFVFRRGEPSFQNNGRGRPDRHSYKIVFPRDKRNILRYDDGDK